MFMNYSWTVHVPFLKIVHEQIMNYGSWTIHELKVHELFMNSQVHELKFMIQLQVHESHQLHELGHFMFMDSSWTVNE